MAKGAKNAWDGNIFIVEADVKDELVEAEQYGQNTGEKNSVEQGTEIAVAGDRNESEKANHEKIEETQEFVRCSTGVDRVSEGKQAPEGDDKKGDEEREAEQFPGMQNNKNNSKEGDTQSEELRE